MNCDVLHGSWCRGHRVQETYSIIWLFGHLTLLDCRRLLPFLVYQVWRAVKLTQLLLSISVPQSLLPHQPIAVQDGLTSLGSNSTKQSSQWVVEVPRVDGKQQLCRMFVRSPNRQVTQNVTMTQKHTLYQCNNALRTFP